MLQFYFKIYLAQNTQQKVENDTGKVARIEVFHKFNLLSNQIFYHWIETKNKHQISEGAILKKNTSMCSTKLHL